MITKQNISLTVFISVILFTSNIFGEVQHEDFWTFMEKSKEGSSFRLNFKNFKVALQNAPAVSERIPSKTILAVPTRAGEKVLYKFYQNSVMHPNLEKKYPYIKTYVGIGINNPSHRATIVINDDIVLGSVITDAGTSHYKTFNINSENNVLLVYEEEINQDLICKSMNTIEEPSRDFPDCIGSEDPCYPVGSELATFKFAVIMTEQANNWVADGTIDGGLTWVVNSVSVINAIYIRDVSFQLQLIGQNDELIFTDSNPAPDAFKTTFDDPWDQNGAELSKVDSVLDSRIGPGGWEEQNTERFWDYGALLDDGYAGGLAYVPGPTSAQLPLIYVFVHEVMHNFGSAHNKSNEGPIYTSIGGSIMHMRANGTGEVFSTHTTEYALNQENNSTGYYHNGINNVITNNIIPEILLPEGGFTIPMETPYVLEGSSDPISEDYTYNWESNDNASVMYTANPDEDFPYFLPDEGSLNMLEATSLEGYKRVFPSMESLLNNVYEEINVYPHAGLTKVKLPFATREMNMRLAVRTNDPYAGSFNHKNLTFFVDGTAGPFRVTSQTGSIVWEVGSEETITWDVANTDDPNGVNCQAVDLMLSLDEGENFDYVLAEGVLNAGSYTFMVPPMAPTSSVRLMVKASENIFFDINNAFFSINNSAIPEMSIDNAPIVIEMLTNSTATFQREITNVGEELSILSYSTTLDHQIDGDGFLGFDGIDDNVDLGSDLLDGAGDFAISLWVKATGTDQVIIQQRNGGYNGQYQLRFTGYGKANFWTYRDGYKWSVTSTQTINDDAWHHIVVLQNADVNGGSIYIDGEETPGNDNGVLNVNGEIHTYLGADMRDLAEYFDGLINDVAIFSGILTGDDIASIYSAGPGFNLTYNHDNYNGSEDLVAFYPIELMEGSLLQDASGNGNNGAIDGASWDGDFEIVPNWLSVSSPMNYLGYGDSDMLDIIVNTAELPVGNIYNSSVIVRSNDEIAIIPVNLTLVSSLSTDPFVVVDEYRLHNAYPNPFNPTTDIRYQIPINDYVSITIFDVTGRNVKSLVRNNKEAGSHMARWDATNNSGEPVTTGMYFFTIQSGDFRQTKKMVLLK